MSSSLISYPCKVCGQSTSHWCSRCQKVWYCTEAHLQEDWPHHRRDCVPVDYSCAPTPTMTISAASHAPPTIISAILLNPNDERSRMTSVACQQNTGGGRNQCPIPLVQSFFAESTPNSLVLTQGLNQEPLRFPLQLWYCPVSLARGSPANKAIHRITSGQTRKTWCGPVVVLKYSGSRRQNYSDATTHDLATLSAYFISLH